MAKIQLNKTQSKTAINPVSDFIAEKKSRYELNVPGTGRLRTSRNHANFHAVSKRIIMHQETEPVKIQRKQKELVKAK